MIIENLNFPQALILLGIAVVALLLVIGVIVIRVGFEEKLNLAKFSPDANNENLFFNPHFPYIHCSLVPGPKDRTDLLMIMSSLPHSMSEEDIFRLLKYIPQLESCVLPIDCQDSDRILILQKSDDIYWGDIQHKILEFIFCKLYQEYGLKGEEFIPEYV